MLLPIDARKAPFKPKYLDEETEVLRRWFVFGRGEDGTVDLSDGQQDVFVGLTPAQAEAISVSRQRHIDEILEILS